MINFERLDAAITYAVEHPEEFDMGDWFKRTDCGTTACLAGTVAIQAGWSPAEFCADDGTAFAQRNGIRKAVPAVARGLLGLVGPDRLGDYIFFLRDLAEVIDVRNRWARDAGVAERSWAVQEEQR